MEAAEKASLDLATKRGYLIYVEKVRKTEKSLFMTAANCFTYYLFYVWQLSNRTNKQDTFEQWARDLSLDTN